MKIIKIINTLTLAILLAYNVSAQIANNKNYEDFESIEGMWHYKNDSVDYTVYLIHKKFMLMEETENTIVGYARLRINDKLIFDNIDKIEIVKNKNVLRLEDIASTKMENNTNPDIHITFHDNGYRALYTVFKHSKMLKFNIQHIGESKHMVWKFTNFSGKGEAWTDQTHFPAVPSTWVLKRIE